MNIARNLAAIMLCWMLPLAAHATDAQPASAPSPAVEADYMPSLITDTPLQGRQLAITIVRNTIGAIQRDDAAKRRVREQYQEDPALLMRAVELVNQEFRIIAEANNYWRNRPTRAATDRRD